MEFSFLFDLKVFTFNGNGIAANTAECWAFLQQIIIVADSSTTLELREVHLLARSRVPALPKLRTLKMWTTQYQLVARIIGAAPAIDTLELDNILGTNNEYRSLPLPLLTLMQILTFLHLKQSGSGWTASCLNKLLTLKISSSCDHCPVDKGKKTFATSLLTNSILRRVKVLQDRSLHMEIPKKGISGASLSEYSSPQLLIESKKSTAPLTPSPSPCVLKYVATQDEQPSILSSTRRTVPTQVLQLAGSVRRVRVDWSEEPEAEYRINIDRWHTVCKGLQTLPLAEEGYWFIRLDQINSTKGLKDVEGLT